LSYKELMIIIYFLRIFIKFRNFLRKKNYLYCNFRLGLANRQQCESALKQTEYDVEMAASLLLDQTR